MTVSTPDHPRAPEGATGASGVSFSWRKLGAVLAPFLVIGAVFALTDLPLCPTRALFGVPCPGCGLTRASAALLRLDLVSVWRFHPLAPVLVPLVLFLLLRTTLVYAGAIGSGAWGALERLPRAVWFTLIVSLVALWGVRLAGGLGGHPDPVDFSAGYLGRVLHALRG